MFTWSKKIFWFHWSHFNTHWLLHSNSLLLKVLPLYFAHNWSSIEYIDGGINYCMTKKLRYLINFITYQLQVKHLDWSTETSSDFVPNLIQHLSGITLSLWPAYLNPNNQNCIFSPAALEYYLKLPSFQIHHLDPLLITAISGKRLTFPFIGTYINTLLLNCCNFTKVKPTTPSISFHANPNHCGFYQAHLDIHDVSSLPGTPFQMANMSLLKILPPIL